MPTTQLDQFLSSYPSQKEAAAALGVSEAHVSRLRSGKRRPSPGLAGRIEQLSGGAFKKEALIWPNSEAA